MEKKKEIGSLLSDKITPKERDINLARHIKGEYEEFMCNTAESFFEMNMTVNMLERFIAGEKLEKDERKIIKDLLKNYAKADVNGKKQA